MTHNFPIRVYYEDTDLAGIVYYANYLKFIERARSEMVRGLGIDQNALKASGMVFAVRHIAADYFLPAVFDDLLNVETELTDIGGARVSLRQAVLRAGALLFEAQVSLVLIGDDARPRRLPADLRARLGDALAKKALD